MTFIPGPLARSLSNKLLAFAMLMLLASVPLSAQNYQIIVFFGAGASLPGPLTVDRFGNLYAPTVEGGFTNNQWCMMLGGCGTAWKFYAHGSSWLGNELYQFTNGTDGYGPLTPIAVAASGVAFGGALIGNGGIYELRPGATRPSSAVAPWNETTVTSNLRPSGYLAIDANGNIYGTSFEFGNGEVFELSPTQGGYTLTTLYTFQGGADGGHPMYGVLLDPAGNLYGTTQVGGSTVCGTVFELTRSGANWTKTTLYAFQGGSDGCQPSGPLARDSAGNLYGGTVYQDQGGPSTVYELSPQNGGWTFSVPQSFSSDGPTGSLAVDTAGDVYGTRGGSIFKLTPSGGNWTYTSLHEFCRGGDDGCFPEGVALDSNGNLFGATQIGGPTNGVCQSGCGTIWEITP